VSGRVDIEDGAGVIVRTGGADGSGVALRVPLHPDGAAVLRGAAQVAERTRIGAAMARLARRFIDLPAGAVEDAIAQALEEIGVELDLDRTYVARFAPDRTTFRVVHEWVGPGVPAISAVTAHGYPVAPWGVAATELLAGREVVLRPAALDPTSAERALLERVGTRATALVPLVVPGVFDGFIGLADTRVARELSPASLATLRGLAEIFAGALARQRADDELQARLRFERLLAELSAGLIAAPPHAVDGAIESALAAIARAQGFERTLVMMLADTRSRFTLTHEWCAPGVDSFGRSITGLPIRDFGWPLSELAAGHTVSFYRDELPPHAEAARRVMEREELTTIVTVPMIIAGATVGCIGFHSRARVPVPADWLARLNLLGTLIACAQARCLAERERQRAFDELARVKAAIERERDYLREEIRLDWNYDAIIGASEGLRRTLGLIDAVAGTDATVLLRGESGVGKELFARAIHARSSRADGPLVIVNCASIPKDLFESEFFGHVRGAFTGAVKDRVGRFELADGGTLFLDEVGEIPIELQAKLLRVLQERELERVGDDRTRRVDVRVIAATHRDLDAEVEAGRFRRDLTYRLTVFPIDIPPLRERKDDVIALAEHFLRLVARDDALVLGAAERERLVAYDWPGNVRELQHVIERAVILSPRPPLRLDLALPAPAVAPAPQAAPGLLKEEDLRTLERQSLVAALEAAGGRIGGARGAAAVLGVHPSTLRDRMRALGIKRPM
jgi:transcriptional regulator with GAF, ATPase, and Fis domain